MFKIENKEQRRVNIKKTSLKKIGRVSGTLTVAVLLYLGARFLSVLESDDVQMSGSDLGQVASQADSEGRGDEDSPPSEGSVLAGATSDSTSTSDPDDALLEPEPFQKEYLVKKGDSLYIALAGFGIGDREIDAITRAIRPVYDLRRIRPGQTIKVNLEEGSDRIDRMVYEIDLLNRLMVERSEDAFSVVKEEVALDRELAHHSGTISDSLYESGVRAGVPIEVIMNLADIFAWDLDFGTDIHPGDQFSLIFEVYKKDGETVRTGRVLAAEMVNRGSAYRAFYFSPPEGRGDYYGENGRSLRKAFLKSPLRYRYISSGYATRRLHPILKVNRPHLGIDFAAPHGTPVRAASDGVVSFVGWKGGNGKTVIIRHPNGYKTLYGHLASFWPGIKKGKRVKQEDFIAKVGSTGLSTGPHLHYTLIKDGKAINPREADRLRGDALPKKWHPLFTEQVELMNRLLNPVRDDASESEST